MDIAFPGVAFPDVAFPGAAFAGAGFVDVVSVLDFLSVVSFFLF